jgi:hypothetical protein
MAAPRSGGGKVDLAPSSAGSPLGIQADRQKMTKALERNGASDRARTGDIQNHNLAL